MALPPPLPPQSSTSPTPLLYQGRVRGPPVSASIYVTDLPEDCTEARLFELFNAAVRCGTMLCLFVSIVACSLVLLVLFGCAASAALLCGYFCLLVLLGPSGVDPSMLRPRDLPQAGFSIRQLPCPR